MDFDSGDGWESFPKIIKRKVQISMGVIWESHIQRLGDINGLFVPTGKSVHFPRDHKGL